MPVPDFEELKFVAETHRHLHDERRRYEVKFLVGTLTVFVLSVAAVLSDKAALPKSVCFVFVVSIALVGLAVITSFYLRDLHRANQVNKIWAVAAENAIMQGDGLRALAPLLKKPPRTREQKVDWSWAWQFVGLVWIALSAAGIVAAVVL